ncbi:MAG: type II secretion system F family protein [Actinomycetota bacterium]
MEKIGYMLPGNKRFEAILKAISNSGLVISSAALNGYKIFASLSFLLLGSAIGKNLMLSITLGITGATVGFFLPNFMVRNIFKNRQQRINNELQYVIDLLYISTLSGQNIYNSIKILIEKYKGEICEEFKQFISDINFGIGKEFAYANLEKKPNTKEFKDLILLLKNAESCGSSVSEILKQKSNYLKFSISQNIERKSRKVSLLILFPLAFLILPSFILLVGGPLIFSIGGDFLV